MEIVILKNNLLEAYTSENLNKISAILLNYYKNQQYGTLQKIADLVGDYITVEIDENGKGFAKLMMLYHPDRGSFHRGNIEKIASENNFDKLLEYAHILKLERLEEISAALESYEDIDYSPVYAWDFEGEGFSVVDDLGKPEPKENEFSRKRKKLTVFDAIKIRYYGHTDREFPTWYLEDLDELELSDSNIGDLDGIQYCTHTRFFDLSDNYIVDLTPLENLRFIEELNLANNRIAIIDELSNLLNLKILNLSDNNITDIKPIMELPGLEYVNLIGNKINMEQISRMEELGIEVEK